MKFEKINDEKLKVSLTYDDMLDFDVITDEEFDIDGLLDIVLFAAEFECDFHLEEAKYYVEIKTMVSREIVLFITKLNEQDSVLGDVLLYSFEDFNDMEKLVKYCMRGYKGDSRIYHYNSKYYMLLSPKDTENTQKYDIFLSEFGKKIKNCNLVLGLLNEYGRIILRNNAIKFLSKL